ncbi:hypothetical protein VPH35_038228 [Triticum aestivum]
MYATSVKAAHACTHLVRYSVRMVITLWAIWGAWRKAVYEDIYQSPLSTHIFIKSYLNDLEVLKKSRATTVQARMTRPTLWIQQPGYLAKLNVDAAIGGSSGEGAVAAVCRDGEGLYLGASAIVFWVFIIYATSCVPLFSFATRIFNCSKVPSLC